MTTHPTVPVRAAADHPLGQRIETAAAALGVEVARAPLEGDGAVVDGVELPADAADWQIEAALLRALRPRHILFLCVANSARSQLGEAVARSVAPSGVKISSAGSEPSSVRPDAVRALEEIGIDASGLWSKGVDDVERPVDAVITLCAEEVCPVWLETAYRLHWGLPDPAAVEGSDEERLEAFRAVRDELRRRLGLLLGSA